MTTTQRPSRYHIKVTVPGRTDGLVIATHHFTDLGEAQDYQDTVARQNLYATDLAVCTDHRCGDHDITRPNGRDE